MEAAPASVLLVEDNPGDARLVREMLRGQGGWRLETVGTLAQAVTALAGGGFDAVLLDLRLPDAQGLDALHAVRDAAPGVPIVVLTGLADEEFGARAVREGAQDYLVKGEVVGPLLVRSLRYAAERAEAERAVRQSEARYSVLFEGAAEGILVADVETRRFRYANPALCRMLGYTEEELTHLSVADIHPREALPHVIAEFEVMMRGEKNLAVGIPCLRKDGTVLYADIVSSPTVIDGLTSNVGFFTDVTERMRAEDAVRKSEVLHRTLVEHLPQRVFIKDRRSVYLSCNANYAADLGIAPEQVVGKDDFAFYPRELAESYRADDQAVMATGTPRDTEERYQAAGQARWVHTIKVPYHDEQGRIIGVLGILEDVTERRGHEEQARWLASFPAENPSPALRVSADGAILYANPAASGLLAHWGVSVGGRLPEPWRRRAAEALVSSQPLRIEEAVGSSAFLLILSPVLENRYVNIYAMDITDRKAAEQELREGEEKYRALFETISDAVIVVDAESERIVDVNRAAVSLYGYSRRELVGLPQSRITAQPEEAHQAPGAGLLGGTRKVPLRHHRKRDGTVFPVDISASVVLIGGRRAVCAVVRDVTERLRAEQQLRESEESFRHLVEASPDIVWSYSDRRGSLYVSARVQEVLGYSPNRLHQEPWLWRESVHAEDRVSIEEAMRQMADGKPLDEEYRIKDSEGRWHWFRDRSIGFVRTENGETIVEGISTDVTDRVEAERQLRLQGSALEAAANGIAIADREGTVLWVNPAFTALTGYGREEAVGSNLGALESRERSAELHAEMWDNVLAGRVWRVEAVNKRKDGSLYAEETTVTPVRDSEGRVTHVIAIKQDVTERKRMERALMEERANLERAVRDRTADLSRSLKSLEETNLRLQEVSHHKDRFLSSMSHELRTPLNAVLGFADLLAGQHFGPLNEKQTGYVGQITASGKHLLALISDLLDLAKIGAGAMGLEPECIVLAECVETVASMMSPQFSKKGLDLVVSLAPDVPTVTADRRKLQQILLNLLTNAVKYTPAGGRVEVRSAAEGDDLVKIEVSDTGIGIAPEDQEVIFEEFRQADGVRDAQLGGVGIGLALTRSLVRMHGGEIGVRSTLGQGSTFWFTLPVAGPPPKPEQRQAEEAAGPATPPPLKGRRILVAEDNEASLAMILDMLAAHDHQVVVARNGEEAVRMAEGHNPELILMDIRMPVMDGLEATRRLRASAQFRDVPIIALSALAGEEAEDSCLRAGCTAHLPKPVRSAQLDEVLSRWLPPEARRGPGGR